MPKRAVVVSFELWQQWITQGYEIQKVRCETGLPANARIIETFFINDIGPAGIFESPSFEPIDGRPYTVTTPSGEEVPVICPIFRQC